MSLFVGLQGKVCVGDVVAEQNTNGSSKEDAGCVKLRHTRLGITENHVKDWAELV